MKEKKNTWLKRLFLNLKIPVTFKKKHLVNNHMEGCNHFNTQITTQKKKRFLERWYFVLSALETFPESNLTEMSKKFLNFHIFFFLIFTFFDSVFPLLRIHPEDITLKMEKAEIFIIVLYISWKILHSLNIPIIWIWLTKAHLQRILCIPKHIYEACIITKKYLLTFYVKITGILKGQTHIQETWEEIH